MSRNNSRTELSSYSDAQLCLLVCEGSDLAFEEISNRYQGLIHLISKEFSYPGFDSGDFLQLGLLGLYKACRAYNQNSDTSFKNFAALCIRRRYISLTRSLRAKKNIPESALINLENSQDITLNSAGPEDLIADKESDTDFLNIVKGKLSYMEFAVMKSFVEGKSYKEIAESLGLDTKAVDNALQRVRKKLLR